MTRLVPNRRMTILAGTVIVTTLMMMTAPSVYAASPDLTITDFGTDGEDNPFLTVKGTAGGTIPKEKDDDVIYAYVFVTNEGVFAVASHPGFDDSDEGSGPEWHAHGLELTGDQPPCIVENSINDDGTAELDGKTVTLKGTDASEVESVLTAALSTETEGGICVVKVFSEG